MKCNGLLISVIVSLFFFIEMDINRYYSYWLLDIDRIKTTIIITLLFCVFYGWAVRQYYNIKFYSEKDDLTGAYNRRFTYKLFHRLLAQISRNNEKIGVLILDVDNFRNIKDTYDHNKGNVVLKNVSDTLINRTRKSDIVARWEGNTFIVIFSISERMSLLSMINCIKNGLEERSKRTQMDISVSIGTAVYPDDGNRLDDLIIIATDRMLEIKSKRKDNRRRIL